MVSIEVYICFKNMSDLSSGNTCTFLGTPYINKCNYDGAGIALSTLLPGLKPAVTPISDNVSTQVGASCLLTGDRL